MKIGIETKGVPKVYYDTKQKKYYCIAIIIKDEKREEITMISNGD